MPVSSRTVNLRSPPAPGSLGPVAWLGATLLTAVVVGGVLVDAFPRTPSYTPAAGPSRRQVSLNRGSPSAPAAAVAQQGEAQPPPVLHFQQLSPEAAYLKNESIPDSKIADSPAHPFYLATGVPADAGAASHCLAQAVYYEAGSESLEGQRAVAQVVLNRLRDRRFPKTVCSVVFEGSNLRTGCQFSFTCDGSLARSPSPAGWLRAQAVAAAALSGYVMTAIGHATHYHTVWVTPYWAAGLAKWGRLGAHIFYRWTGGGAPAEIGLRSPEPTAPLLLDLSVTDRAGALDAPGPQGTTAKPPSPSASPTPAISLAPTAWSPAAATLSAVPAPRSAVSEAPYQAVRTGAGIDSPHFAARDHR